MARSRFSQMRITRGALYLLIAEAGLSLVYLAANEELRGQMEQWLMASDVTVWEQGKIWTLVTGALLQPHFVGLLFHGLILWMFVPVLERWWGLKRFLLFALYTSLVGAIAGTLVGLGMAGEQAITGLDAFIYATIIAYGVLYADSHVQFFGVLPMTGRQLMIGISGFILLLVAFTQDWARGASYVAAMALAAGITTGKFSPRLWYLRWKQKRIRRHLKVMHGGKDKKKDRWIN